MDDEKKDENVVGKPKHILKCCLTSYFVTYASVLFLNFICLPAKAKLLNAPAKADCPFFSVFSKNIRSLEERIKFLIKRETCEPTFLFVDAKREQSGMFTVLFEVYFLENLWNKIPCSRVIIS